MYTEAQETLINLFEDALVLGKRFNRDRYKEDFESHYNKYKDFFINVNESLREEEGKDAVIAELAELFRNMLRKNYRKSVRKENVNFSLLTIIWL